MAKTEAAEEMIGKTTKTTSRMDKSRSKDITLSKKKTKTRKCRQASDKLGNKRNQQEN